MTDPLLPPSVPVKTRCALERRTITAITRSAVRALVIAGVQPEDAVLVHRCRGCRQTHVVTLGEIDWYREMQKAS